MLADKARMAQSGVVPKGLFGGGLAGSVIQNVIDYITIATLGNAADFGDLTVGRSGLAACSNDHGGLQ